MSDDLLLRRYILGRVPDAEAPPLEDRLFGDPAVAERAAFVEAELMDEFAAGVLSPADRADFEQYLAAHPSHQRRAAFARALQARAAASRPRPAWTWLAIAAGLVLAVFLGLRQFRADSGTLAVTLTPGTLRSAESVQTIPLARQATVTIRWSQPGAARAEIRFVDTGAAVWTGPVDDGRSIVPASALAPGDHTALVFDTSGQELADYTFQVRWQPDFVTK